MSIRGLNSNSPEHNIASTQQTNMAGSLNYFPDD
jgi:hypothetical protein